MVGRYKLTDCFWEQRKIWECFCWGPFFLMQKNTKKMPPTRCFHQLCQKTKQILDLLLDGGKKVLVFAGFTASASEKGIVYHNGDVFIFFSLPSGVLPRPRPQPALPAVPPGVPGLRRLLRPRLQPVPVLVLRLVRAGLRGGRPPTRGAVCPTAS